MTDNKGWTDRQYKWKDYNCHTEGFKSVRSVGSSLHTRNSTGNSCILLYLIQQSCQLDNSVYGLFREILSYHMVPISLGWKMELWLSWI